MLVLVGDVGGTKTRLALYEIEKPSGFKRTVVEKFDSKTASCFEDIVSSFLSKQGSKVQIDSACFGIPGPVVRGTVRATNLPWVL